MPAPSPGDKVRVITAEKSQEGILIPSPKKDAVVLKLDTGYNVGIGKSSIKKIEVLEKKKALPAKKAAARDNPKLPTIAILHTGGTIASKVDYRTGGVIAGYSAEDFLALFPEIQGIANVRTQLVANM